MKIAIPDIDNPQDSQRPFELEAELQSAMPGLLRQIKSRLHAPSYLSIRSCMQPLALVSVPRYCA